MPPRRVVPPSKLRRSVVGLPRGITRLQFGKKRIKFDAQDPFLTICGFILPSIPVLGATSPLHIKTKSIFPLLKRFYRTLDLPCPNIVHLDLFVRLKIHFTSSGCLFSLRLLPVLCIAFLLNYAGIRGRHGWSLHARCAR